MRALIAVEWRRYVSRRLTRLATLAAIGVLLFAGVMTFIQAGRDARQFQPENRAFTEEIERCVQEDFGPEGQGFTEEERRQQCEDAMSFDPRFHYTTTKDVLMGAGSAFVLLAYLIGASFMGAEWHFGTITTTLTWEPRRIRVLAAKVIVAVVAGVLLFVFLEALLAAVLYPAAAVHGVTEGVDGEWVRSVLGDVARGAGIAAFGSAVGLAVAAIGRNTAAALGGGFLYFAVLEPTLRALRPKWAPWLVGDNATVFITGDPLMGRSAVEAAIILLAYSAVVIFICGALLQRRDVTT